MLLHLSLLSWAIVAVFATADQSPALIAGCDEVSCPVTDAGHYDTCTVAEDTFQGVGLVRIDDLPASISGMYLVKGAGVLGADPYGVSSPQNDDSGEEIASEREFKSVYYLANPSSQGISPLSGCVVIFHGLESLKFDGSGIQSSAGQCRDVIENDCIDALKGIANDAADEQNRCAAVDKKLSEGIVEACNDFAGKGKGLGHFTTTDLSALSPISAEHNQSSNCWPAVPKNSSLSYIDDDVTTGNTSYDSLIANLYKITPILTLFDGTSDDSKPSSALSCVKLVTSKNLLRPSMDGGKKEGGAGSASWNIGAPMMAVAGLFLGL